MILTIFWIGFGFTLKYLIWKSGRKVEKTSHRYRQWLSFAPILAALAGLKESITTGLFDEAVIKFVVLVMFWLVILCIGAAIHSVVRPSK